ncbi:MAG: hypothetical protein JW767_07615 [Thermoleophilia bacterium]|nr:hypothetical protein [Thermoleophilia bacterium]
MADPMAASMAAAGPPPVVVVRKESSPGIATAGFVLVLVGLFVPLVGLVGFILSILGYRQAKREGLPTGLGLAGIIIGAIAVSSEASVDMGLLLQAWC